MEFEENSVFGSVSRVLWYFFCDSLVVGSAAVGVIVLGRAFDVIRQKCGFSSKKLTN